MTAAALQLAAMQEQEQHPAADRYAPMARTRSANEEEKAATRRFLHPETENPERLTQLERAQWFTVRCLPKPRAFFMSSMRLLESCAISL